MIVVHKIINLQFVHMNKTIQLSQWKYLIFDHIVMELNFFSLDSITSVVNYIVTGDNQRY